MRTDDDRTILSEEELAELLTAHEGPADPIANGAGKRAAGGVRRRGLLMAAAVATLALLLGSGLGFGIGSSVTPSVSAGKNVVGFGFVPGRGWDVVQNGGAKPGTTEAVASKNGIVISVTSAPRGDPAEDVRYPLRELPLRVADARRIPGDPFRLTLRAGVGGYNIDASVSFAGSQPTATMLAAAQQQLDRLVVAADRVTIAVRPAIGSRLTSQITAFGTIDSGKAGESVTVQAKECDNSFFRVFAGASTEEGGTWSTLIFPSISMTLRAVWNGETSNEVSYRRRAYIQLYRLAGSATKYRMYLGQRFAGKSVSIQRFDQRIGRWKSIRRIPAHATNEGTRFTLRTPKGTRIRAVIPTSQARPCFLSGISQVIRT